MTQPATSWVDSHCHLPADPPAADEILARARAAGVAWVVNVGTDLTTSRAALATARRRDDVVATVGLHPHDARQLADEWPELVALAREAGVVAIGEAGLDHHYDHSPRPDQADAFRAQIGLANELDRTLVIHTREAWDETFSILDAESTPRRTVFHCFTGGPDEAAACVTRGAWLSFSGIVTFKTADDVRDAAAVTPTDRLLIETDSPYLAPVPHRGQPNEPGFLPDVATGLAAARGVGIEQIAAATRANAEALFGPPAVGRSA